MLVFICATPATPKSSSRPSASASCRSSPAASTRSVLSSVIRLYILTRLSQAERTAYIKSGSVFVWEESDDELGLKRWTDGRFWSQSRMREPFLFYEERVVDRVPNEPRYAFLTHTLTHSRLLIHSLSQGLCCTRLVPHRFSLWFSPRHTLGILII